jgi:hypothetical protein
MGFGLARALMEVTKKLIKMGFLSRKSKMETGD